MYSLAPLAPITTCHVGFGLLCFLFIMCFIAGLFAWWTDEGPGLFAFTIISGTAIMFLAYFVSFQWTDQIIKTYENTPVQAQFLGFETEGYRERSGKSMVDRHVIWVQFSVNGDHVLVQGVPGAAYQDTMTLYKN